MEKDVDKFVMQLQHLIDEYCDCDINNSELIGALEMVKYDYLKNFLKEEEER